MQSVSLCFYGVGNWQDHQGKPSRARRDGPLFCTTMPETRSGKHSYSAGLYCHISTNGSFYQSLIAGGLSWCAMWTHRWHFVLVADGRLRASTLPHPPPPPPPTAILSLALSFPSATSTRWRPCCCLPHRLRPPAAQARNLITERFISSQLRWPKLAEGWFTQRTQILDTLRAILFWSGAWFKSVSHFCCHLVACTSFHWLDPTGQKWPVCP